MLEEEYWHDMTLRQQGARTWIWAPISENSPMRWWNDTCSHFLPDFQSREHAGSFSSQHPTTIHFQHAICIYSSTKNPAEWICQKKSGTFKMEDSLNLIAGYFFGVGFPFKPYPYGLYKWGFLHFRYLKCLVTDSKKNKKQIHPFPYHHEIDKSPPPNPSPLLANKIRVN